MKNHSIEELSTTLVHIQVLPECLDDFIAATIKNRAGTLLEEGNRRFDFIQSKENPCYFILFEVFANKEAALAHKETAHYLAWRDAVAQMMASPRRGEPFTNWGI